MKVFLAVWWFDRFGGMERHVAELAVALASHGVDVTVFSEMPLPPANRYGRALRAAGIEIVAPRQTASFAVRAGARLGIRRSRRTAEECAGWVPDDLESASPTTRALLAAMARRGLPDILHVHGCRLGQSAIIRWASVHGITCVYTEHVTIDDWGGPRDVEAPAIIAAAADAIACVSDYSRISLAAYLPLREIAVVRHIVADPGPSPQPTGSPPRLFAVGRLAAHKGYDTLLRALAALRGAEIDATLDIAGDGPERGALRTLCQTLGLEAAVRFHGEIDAGQIDALWRAAGIGVMASLTEGLPLSIVEAMAHGRPVVATAVGGIPEIVDDGETGLLVPPADAPRFAAALRRLIDDSAFAARMGSSARHRYATGGWSAEGVAGQTLKLYAEARRRCAARSNPANEARTAAGTVRDVHILIWRLARFGMMERFAAREAAALAAAGVAVTFHTERRPLPFNRYAALLRGAGVKLVAGRGVTAHVLDGVRPCAVHVHGWRWGQGWTALAPLLDRATAHGVPTRFVEHAAGPGPPSGPAIRAGRWVAAVDCPAAAGTAPVAAIVAEALGMVTDARG